MVSTRAELAAAAFAVAVSLAIGTVAYQFLEGWTPVQSFYFSVVTLTTVGYGDLHPTTEMSMLFTSFYILTNVAIVLAALSIIGTQYIKQREKGLKESMNRLRDVTPMRDEDKSILDGLRENLHRKVAKNHRKRVSGKR